MYKIYREVTLLTIFLFLGTFILGFYSCSGPGTGEAVPVAPGTNSSEITRNMNWTDTGRGPVGFFHVRVPATGGEAIITSERAGNFHVNITDYLAPPACTNCVYMSHFIPGPGGGIVSDVTIRNPFKDSLVMSASDVRLVVQSQWTVEFQEGRVSDLVVDPDGFTDRYPSDLYQAAINPYINFGNFENGYSIPSGEQSTKQVHFLPDEPFADFTLVIDVSWQPPQGAGNTDSPIDTHCKEAFRLEPSMIASFVPGNQGVMINLKVYDWQDDSGQAQVTVEAPTLTPDIKTLALNTLSDIGYVSFAGFVLCDYPVMAKQNPILIKVKDQFLKTDGTHPTAYKLIWFATQ